MVALRPRDCLLRRFFARHLLRIAQVPQRFECERQQIGESHERGLVTGRVLARMSIRQLQHAPACSRRIEQGCGQPTPHRRVSISLKPEPVPFRVCFEFGLSEANRLALFTDRPERVPSAGRHRQTGLPEGAESAARSDVRLDLCAEGAHAGV